MGVRFPLPAPSISFIYNHLRIMGLVWPSRSGTNTVQRVSRLFQYVEDLSYSAYVSTLYVDNFIYARLRNARRIIDPRERHFLRWME